MVDKKPTADQLPAVTLVALIRHHVRQTHLFSFQLRERQDEITLATMFLVIHSDNMQELIFAGPSVSYETLRALVAGPCRLWLDQGPLAVSEVLDFFQND